METNQSCFRPGALFVLVHFTKKQLDHFLMRGLHSTSNKGRIDWQFPVASVN